MAVSTELINSTLADLAKRAEHSFVRENRFLKALEAKSNINKASTGGSYIERTIFAGSPAVGIGVSNGDEVATPTRVQKTKKYQVGYYEYFCPIIIPGKEVRQNNGVQGAVKLVKEYPLAALEAFQMDFNKYLLTGTTDSLSSASAADFYGFLTLNGDFASGTETGTTNGLMDFAAPSAQTDVVQSVAKDAGVSHFNQYGLITAFATDGIRTLRSGYRAGAAWGGGKEPDLVIMDDLTYGNYEEYKTDLVRLQVGNDKDVVDTSNTLYNARVHFDLALALSAFSGTGTGGVSYILNTSYFELCMLMAPKVEQFADKLVDQDVLSSKLIFHGQLVCTRLPAQAVIGGGAS